MALERYSHVMHLTSQVAGDLATARNAVDVLRATFPAGTVSGAPKVRAMEIIDELEPTKRGAVRRRGRLRRLLRQPRHRDRDPHDGVARRPGERAGRRRDRGRLGRRRRRPGMPQQGAGVAHRGAARKLAPRATPQPPEPAPGSTTRRTSQTDETRRRPMDLHEQLAAPRRRAPRSCGARPRPRARRWARTRTPFLQALVSADLDPLADGDGVASRRS